MKGSAAGGGEESFKTVTSVVIRPLIRPLWFVSLTLVPPSPKGEGISGEQPRASVWCSRVRLFSFLPRGISPLRLRSGRNDKFVRGLLTSKPSVGRDALVPPHNVHSWFRFAPALFYNVISTGVRTTVRTQWRNPPRSVSHRRRVGWRVYAGGISFPRDCHVARCAPRNDKAVRVYACFIMSFRPE